MRALYNGNYIQYYIDGLEAIASDGITPFDGRLGLQKLIDIAEKKLNSEFFKVKGYNGYAIIKRNNLIYTYGEWRYSK